MSGYGCGWAGERSGTKAVHATTHQKITTPRMLGRGVVSTLTKTTAAQRHEVIDVEGAHKHPHHTKERLKVGQGKEKMPKERPSSAFWLVRRLSADNAWSVETRTRMRLS